MAYKKPTVKLFRFETYVVMANETKETNCRPSACVPIQVRCRLPYWN